MADADFGGLPPTAGLDFTKKIHNKVEGSIDPANNQVNGSFVVCVTGAGKGCFNPLLTMSVYIVVGFYIAVAYAKANVTGLVISSRTTADLDALTAEIKTVNAKVDVLAQVCDTTKEEDVQSLLDATKKRFGRLDVCVANAGIISKYLPDGTLPKGIDTDFDFERVIDINLLGSVRIAREFIPLLIESNGAKTYVVITSLAAHMVHSQFTPIAYNVSKRGVCHLVEQMALDHAKDGILSYSVHPGAVLTPQTQHHSLEKGDVWDTVLTDDVDLCGGFLTWLTKERRDFLNGRYLSVNWDVDELVAMKDDIVKKDLLKFKMTV